MRRLLATSLAIVGAIAVWAFVLVFALLNGWTRWPIAPEGDSEAFMQALIQKVEEREKGNIALALLEDGEVVYEHYGSMGAAVDGDTLFQVASLSKWITAWGVMKLAEAGSLDLDRPVSEYLTRWRLPESEFDTDKVTVRRLLSHTAGLTDGLGYGGFEDPAELQTLEESLTSAADAFWDGQSEVRVGAEPGEAWAYSGGGYTLLQLVIEEISGRSFNDYMTNEVLRPLGMSRSTFVVDRSTERNLAESYHVDGTRAPLYYYTALAAASLFTSVNDLVRFVQAHLAGADGEPVGRGVVSAETLTEMRNPQGKRFLIPVWGLGLAFYAQGREGGYIIGHSGGNRPAINTEVRLDPQTGDAIILLSSGDPNGATRIANDWTRWQSGNLHGIGALGGANNAMRAFFLGSLVILLGGSLASWWRARRASATRSA